MQNNNKLTQIKSVLNKDINYTFTNKYKESKMKKKHLIMVAIAVAMSVSPALATDITGVSGVNNVYNINPAFINGDVGYRKYDNFVLSEGDIANLIYNGTKRGENRDLNHFINLVKNGVNINGILNTTRNGQFFNGNAVFITPGGMAIGASGVLNVGSLSVATPTTQKYNQLISEFDNNDVTNIKNVSKLKQDGNAPINVEGKIIARQGVDLRGSNINVSGGILNGVNNNQVFSTKAQADQLFNSLVNTNGVFAADSTAVNNGSLILIKSSDKTGAGIKITGTVANNATGKVSANTTSGVYITNYGANGLTANGNIIDRTQVRLNNNKGNLVIGSNANVQAPHAVALNKGAALTMNSGAKVTGDKVEMYQKGTGLMKIDGNVTAEGILALKNETGTGMEINGTLKNKEGANPNIQLAINNNNGDLLINGTITNAGNLGINNRGNGNGSLTITKNANIKSNGEIKIANERDGGMTIVGKINSNNSLYKPSNIYIYNDAGHLTFANSSDLSTAANVTSEGNVYIAGRKNSTGITTQEGTSIIGQGVVAIRNKGENVAPESKGLNLQGNISGNTVAINNESGDMYVSGVITAKDNMGIINRAGGGNMTLASNGKINANGNANIKNYGMGNMTVNSEITNSGRVNVIANSGTLNLGATVHNNSGALGENGGFYAVVRENGTGMNVTSEFVVDGNGEVLIKNISGDNGLRFAGTANTTNHQVGLVNKKGDMNVTGNITTTKAPIVISNEGAKLNVNANLTSGSDQGRIVNRGSQAATVNQDKLNNVKFYEKVKEEL